MLFLRIKAVKGKKMTADESEIMCDSCHFMIKNGTNGALIEVGLKFFWELITFTNYSIHEENYFYKELFKNWRKYFDFELLLKNKIWPILAFRLSYFFYPLQNMFLL